MSFQTPFDAEAPTRALVAALPMNLKQVAPKLLTSVRPYSCAFYRTLGSRASLLQVWMRKGGVRAEEYSELVSAVMKDAAL